MTSGRLPCIGPCTGGQVGANRAGGRGAWSPGQRLISHVWCERLQRVCSDLDLGLAVLINSRTRQPAALGLNASLFQLEGERGTSRRHLFHLAAADGLIIYRRLSSWRLVSSATQSGLCLSSPEPADQHPDWTRSTGTGPPLHPESGLTGSGSG